MTPLVSVVVPSKKGRERVLADTLAAYGTTAPEAQVVIPEEYDTVGEAWNAGARRAQGEYLLFTTDDCIPHDGWLAAMLDTWDAPDNENVIAAPVLEYPVGGVEAYGSMGGGMKLPGGSDWMRVRTSGVLAMQRHVFVGVGDFADLHYYVDDDWCWRADLLECWVVVRDAFRFTHAHQPDRGVIQAANEHRARFLERVAGKAKV